ncbi:MAG: hypothetical protein COB26_04300 [Piscirickettsiaceae bacterium]|nr:MAG: hypothetical protein COB26_04300 [Piscirickettsiaceae bacterium]
MQYALCPNCSSTLQVSQQQLEAKNGLVRCGHCNDILDANKHQLTTTETTQALALVKEQDVITNANEPQPPVEKTKEPKEEEKKPEETPLAVNAVWEESTKKSASRIPFGVLSFFLFIGLIYQFISHYPDYFTQNTSLQPAFEQINTSFGLSIPRYQSTEDIRVLDRQLALHPTRANTLQLKLTIKNNAPVNQNYPLINLNFSTGTGKHIARITIRKEDYLDSSDIYDAFKPFSTKHLTINLSTPKQPITGFEIYFSF